jgi:small-conductance mechanosensitive channel
MLNIWNDIFQYIEPYIDIVGLLIAIIIVFLIFSVTIRIIEKKLVKKVTSKKQITTIATFIGLFRFIFIIFLIVIAISSYFGGLDDVGFIVGLLTVAIGWALREPISCVVAWMIIVTRRPIHIGDRVIISNIKGDISDITLMHIFLDEVGGTIEGEETSNRTVMIPTSVIFQKDIINYTSNDEYILDEITTSITYESDLKKAEDIILSSTEKIMKSYWKKFPKKFPKKAHNRLKFKDSGIDIIVRYYSIAKMRNNISTKIIREIFNKIRETKDVEIAYPHTEVLFREKNK